MVKVQGTYRQSVSHNQDRERLSNSLNGFQPVAEPGLRRNLLRVTFKNMK